LKFIIIIILINNKHTSLLKKKDRSSSSAMSAEVETWSNGQQQHEGELRYVHARSRGFVCVCVCVCACVMHACFECVCACMKTGASILQAHCCPGRRAGMGCRRRPPTTTTTTMCSSATTTTALLQCNGCLLAQMYIYVWLTLLQPASCKRGDTIFNAGHGNA